MVSRWTVHGGDASESPNLWIETAFDEINVLLQVNIVFKKRKERKMLQTKFCNPNTVRYPFPLNRNSVNSGYRTLFFYRYYIE